MAVQQQASEEQRREPSLAKKLLTNIDDGPALLFHNQYNEPYIAYAGNGTYVAKMTSSEVKEWLARYCWEAFKQPLSSDTANKVINTLAGRARFDGPLYELQVRHVLRDQELWYDLGNGKAAHITSKGWEVTAPPIIFQHLPHQKVQVEPRPGGNIELLKPYINLENKDELLLFIVYVATACIPNFPHPLLILHGPQGAGKTTPMRVIKELVDPSQIQGLASPKDADAFVQTAIEHSFLFYDNLTTIPG